MNEMETGLGQLFMVGLPGTELDHETQALIASYGIGNFILFRRNVTHPLQMARLCRDLRAACKDNGLPSPLISIDQEGGPVARLGPPFTQFAGAAAIGRAADPEAEARSFARITARELQLVGCNMNLAPVLDLEVPGSNRVMKGRTFSSDPERVAHLGSIIIRDLQKEGILATAKHFPGIGGVNLDPHQDLPLIDTPAAELEESPWLPFRRAIAARVAAVMTAHVIYTALDPRFPATLSPACIADTLRGRMGYAGLVVTDDLEMGAIARHFSIEESAVLAFKAGADLLLICQEKEKMVQAFEALRGFLDNDRSGRRRLEEALGRVMAAKRDYNIAREFDEAAIRNYFRV